MSATAPMPNPIFDGPFSAADLTRYQRDGFLRVPGLFAADEIAPLCNAVTQDPSAGGRVYSDSYADVPDSDAPGDQDDRGNLTPAHEYAGWTGPGGDDLLGTLIRIERIVDRAEQLVGEPVYHWHTNLVRKPARSTGRIPWHSDLGSWYADGVLEAALCSCVLALTPTTIDNGCLRFMRGSQRTGRLDRVADEHVAFNIEANRLAAMLERYEPVAIELSPGDAVFFHPAAVHSSQSNQTDNPRTQLVFTYNAVSNPPIFDDQTHHAYHPLHKTSDTSLRNGKWKGVFERTRATRIGDPSDPAAVVYRVGPRKAE